MNLTGTWTVQWEKMREGVPSWALTLDINHSVYLTRLETRNKTANLLDLIEGALLVLVRWFPETWSISGLKILAKQCFWISMMGRRLLTGENPKAWKPTWIPSLRKAERQLHSRQKIKNRMYTSSCALVTTSWCGALELIKCTHTSSTLTHQACTHVKHTHTPRPCFGNWATILFSVILFLLE